MRGDDRMTRGHRPPPRPAAKGAALARGKRLPPEKTDEMAPAKRPVRAKEGAAISLLFRFLRSRLPLATPVHRRTGRGSAAADPHPKERRQTMSSDKTLTQADLNQFT